ncbi:unnamed protein product [Brassica oleracea]
MKPYVLCDEEVVSHHFTRKMCHVACCGHQSYVAGKISTW